MPVLTSKQQEQKSKQRKIRNSEYYDMEGTFDRLYAESKKDKTFNHLMEIIESEENIKLAYRTIKKNTGSDTSGVDKRTIADLAKLSEEAIQLLSSTPSKACGDTKAQWKDQTSGNSNYRRSDRTAMYFAGHGADM